MPIYEYRCPRCDRRFEELVSLSAAEGPQHCPSCGCASAHRVLSCFAVHVKGGRTSGGGKSCGGCAKSSCTGCH